MSKLTGWIETNDSLDVQKIVENYEKELASNKNNEIKSNDTKHLVGDEVWSGTLDEFNNSNITKTKPIDVLNEKKTCKLNAVEPKSNKFDGFNDSTDFKATSLGGGKDPIIELNDKDQKFDKIENEIKFDSVIEDEKKDKTIEFNIDNKIEANDEIVFDNLTKEEQTNKTKTINFFDVLDNDQEIKETRTKTIEFNSENNYISESSKTINFDSLHESNDNNEDVKTMKDHKILEVNKMIEENKRNNLKADIINEEEKPTANFSSKTVLFDSLISESICANNEVVKDERISVSNVKTKLIDDEVQPKKENTIQFKQIDLNQDECLQNIPRFNIDDEDFEKMVEQNDSKTIKFQSTSNNLEKDEEPSQPRFTKHLTNMCFNETINVKDLDLTKEINDADAIKVNTDTKKKKKSWFFSKKKNK